MVRSGAVPTPAPAAAMAPDSSPVATPVGGTPSVVPLSPIACFPEYTDTYTFDDEDGEDEYYSAQAAEKAEEADAHIEVCGSGWHTDHMSLPPAGGTGCPWWYRLRRLDSFLWLAKHA